MKRPHYLLAGVIAYLLAVKPMVYFVGFLANRWVPKGIDDGVAMGWDGGWGGALAVDLALLLSFALVHSLLARPRIKRSLLGWVPAALERSAYSAVAGIQMLLLMALWRPLPEPVWRVEAEPLRGLLWAAFGLGWIVVATGLLTIGNTRMFGLRQAWAGAWDRPYVDPGLAPRGIYCWIRMPLYSGSILGLFATPEMSRGHLLLAVVLSAYILVGARFEERDQIRLHGRAYLAYREQVPAYLPRLGRTHRISLPPP